MTRYRKLDVLISTRGRSGIDRVAQMQLPRVVGVTYVVSWQIGDDDDADRLPESLRRDDVVVFPTHTTGLSVNRNNSLMVSEAELCLIADDDLSYTARQLTAVIDTFDSNPDVELATFMYEGDSAKSYPDGEADLTRLPKNYSVSSIEIAFRRRAIVDRGLSFNPHFGVGAPVLHSGEDGVFLLDARRAGVRCRFFPVVITRHDGLSTGNRPITDRGVIMAEGAYIFKAYGATGALRLPLYVWRNRRRGRLRFFWGLRWIVSGYLYGMKV